MFTNQQTHPSSTHLFFSKYFSLLAKINTQQIFVTLIIWSYGLWWISWIGFLCLGMCWCRNWLWGWRDDFRVC